MEPIAIIGIGCRFPGGISSPEAFWRFVSGGGDAITPIPSSRFDVDALYCPVPGTPGKIATRQGGFLDSIDLFDAYFFGVSPREVDSLDPQQRLLLEVTWEAFEDAGMAPDKLAGSRTGVFMGMWGNDYERLGADSDQDIDLHTIMGCSRFAAAGRISFFFDLRGPSLVLDTATSSSLVAVHLACQSLWTEECTLAVAGGVNLILEPHRTIGFSRSGMLSPAGRCKFGDAQSDGYGRAEGVGVVVLKTLSQALADRDPIYALIRGSAVNSGGQSSDRLVAPSVEAELALFREAYARARLSPTQVRYVEMHGTGTRLGDWVEVQALGQFLAEQPWGDRPCAIGSVKTNLGHAESAAGVAGLIKVALCLKHRMIPPSLHFNEPNPQIPWQDLPVKVQTSLAPWPEANRPACAGVTSLGVTGTNAHVVLTEAPPSPGTVCPAGPRAYVLPLSAKTPPALAALAQAYKAFFASDIAAGLHDVCYTQSCRRAHHAARLAVVGQSQAEMLAQLEALAEQSELDLATLWLDRPRVVFVFPGQGGQWVGMGRELYAREPAFANGLQQCEEAMRPFVDWSLLEQLSLAPSSPRYRLDEISVLQPVLFSIEVALALQWQAWGVKPEAVIGHSMGEAGAAFIAGSLSLEDALRVICCRSQLLLRLRGKGAMAIVELGMAEAQAALHGYEDRLAVAGSNSPQSTLLAGDPLLMDQVLAKLQSQDVFCRLIKADVASHCPDVEPLLPELRAALADLCPRPATLPIYSTALGALASGREYDAAYWARNLRQPVLFAPMIQQLLADGYNVFIEIGPHPILTAVMQQGFKHAGRAAVALPSLRRGEAEQAALLNVLGQLYCHGYPVTWERLYPGGGAHAWVPLYPWQRERYQVKAARVRAAPPDLPVTQPAAGPPPPAEPRQAASVGQAVRVAQSGRERRTLLETYLRQQTGQVLRLASSRVLINAPFKTLGIDSFMALELRNRIEADLALSLPATVIWNYPTITALTAYLAKRMGILLEDNLNETALPEDQGVQTSLENLSKDDVEALLAEELTAVSELLKGGRE